MNFLLALALFSQQQDPVFRAGVDYVRVDAQVLEGRRPVSGLQMEHFAIFDEGAPQEIAYFAREQEPLWLVLLLDVSGSMSKRLVEMGTVARAALAVLQPGDQVSVMLFSRKTRLAQPFTADPADAAAAVSAAARERSLGAGTDINGAIVDAAEYLRTSAVNKPGRRAVIILTDNGGLAYQRPNEAVTKVLFAADTVLNAIVTPDARPPDPPPPNANPDFTPHDVFRLANETGGEILRAEKTGETFRQMLERARTRYSLHYKPPAATPGSFRSVRVELTPAARKRHPRAEVRARAGYEVRD
jgi:VWFA-related protein